MSVIHLKKKDIVKSKKYGKSPEYTKPLEITRRFANDESIMGARRVESGEAKPFQRFVHFTVMKNVVPEATRENGIWWIGSGENRRRDDDEATQEEEARR
ncbi:hypothetical protein Dimus_000497 [Dionaea muscipula]